MADNVHKYGLRWSRAFTGKSCPNPMERVVASEYQATNDGGGTNVDLNIGDPVKQLADGTIALATQQDHVWGVIVGFKPYWDGSKMVPTSRLPGGTAWGTIEERKSIALVVPATPETVWEVDVNGTSSSYDTEAEYRAFIGSNCEMDVPGDTSDSSKPKADPMIDPSTIATTGTLEWRIVGISPTEENRDWTGNYVKLLVSPNIHQHPGTPAEANVKAGI